MNVLVWQTIPSPVPTRVCDALDQLRARGLRMVIVHDGTTETSAIAQHWAAGISEGEWAEIPYRAKIGTPRERLLEAVRSCGPSVIVAVGGADDELLQMAQQAGAEVVEVTA